MSYGWQNTFRYGGAWLGRRRAEAFNPRVFDSGLGLPFRTLAQSGVVELLRRLHRGNGGYLEALEETDTHVKGDHDEQGIALVLDQLGGRAPAILVATGDKPSQPAGGGGFNWASELSVHVYVICNSLRSRMARLVGDAVSAASTTADPGAHVILEHVEELLLGRNPGAATALKELRAVTEVQLVSDQTWVLWQQVYTVKVSRTINAKRDLDLELRHISTYHRLADLQLPTDKPIQTTETDLEQ